MSTISRVLLLASRINVNPWLSCPPDLKPIEHIIRYDCQEIFNCVCALSVHFYSVEDKSGMFFSYFMNQRIQTDLPLKKNVSLIYVNKWNTLTN